MNPFVGFALCFVLLHCGLVACMTKAQFWTTMFSWFVGIIVGTTGMILLQFTKHDLAGGLLCVAAVISFACTAQILQNFSFPGDNEHTWWQHQSLDQDSLKA